MWIYIILSLVVIGVDQGVKYLVVQNISLGNQVEVIPGLFSLTHLENSGAAWSILEGKMWFFVIVTLVAVSIIIYLFITQARNKPLYQIGLALVFAGAVGNFIDRIHQGYVVDMFQLDFINFPIFNVADFSLTIGIILIFIFLIIDERQQRSTNGK